MGYVSTILLKEKSPSKKMQETRNLYMKRTAEATKQNKKKSSLNRQYTYYALKK
jgi:hypothetical protein